MSKATYRGVCYDTEQYQKEFKDWWNQIHCDATKRLNYRGKDYRVIEQCQTKYW